MEESTFGKAYEEKCCDLQIEPLREVVSISSESTELDLSELTLGTKNSIAIGYALSTDTRISRVILSESYMGDEGCMEFCRFLHSNSTITYLSLSGSNIHSRGTIALSEFLRTNQSLTHLILEWNSCGALESGISHLSGSLIENRILTHLDLRNNRITSEGSLHLARALSQNSILESLDLRWNSIGENGASFLLESLQGNRTIIELHLSGNEIQYGTLEQFRKLVERNIELRQRLVKEEQFVSEMDFKMDGMRQRQADQIESLKGRLVGERDGFRSQIRETETEIDRMRSNLGQEKRNRVELRTELEKKELVIEELVAEKTVLEAKIQQQSEVSSHETESITQQLQSVTDLQKSTSSMLETTTRELAAANLSLEKFRTENVRLSEINSQMNEEMTQKDAKLRDATAKLREALEESTIASEKLLMAHKKAQEYAQSESKIEALTNENHRLRSDVDLARAEVEQRVSETKNRFQLELAQATRDAEEKYVSEQLRAKKLETQLEGKQTEIISLHDRMESLRRQLESTQKTTHQRIEALRLANTTLENEQATAVLENKNLSYELALSREKQREVERGHEKELDKLNGQLENIQDQHGREKSGWSRRLEEKESEIEHLQRETQQLKRLISTMKDQQEQDYAAMEQEMMTHVRRVFETRKSS